MASQRDAFYDPDHVFDQNMMFAFGLTAYDSEQYSIEDPTIGLLKPYYKSWGILNPDYDGTEFTPLRYHTCSREELRLDEVEELEQDLNT